MKIFKLCFYVLALISFGLDIVMLIMGKPFDIITMYCTGIITIVYFIESLIDTIYELKN